MAKWGEGDERWKVADLGESGRNVNGWHWTEFNAVPWSRDRLKELLGGVVLVDIDGFQIKAAEDITLTGEATINQRKGKIIPAYELDLSLKWKGINAAGKECTGEVKVPYISEENHDEDPEVQITASADDGEKLRSLIVTHGRPVVYKAIAEFVQELRAGGPLKGEGTVGGQGEVHQSASMGAITPPSVVPSAVEREKTGGRTIEITETFYASSRDLYECFTDPSRMRAYTGSGAEADCCPGGSFSMFGGSIEGTYRELQPHSLIDMDWRFSSWPDGAVSRVIITLEEKEKGSVILALRQTGIPEADRYGNHDVVGMTQAGWRQQVLLRIRRIFGYGA